MKTVLSPVGTSLVVANCGDETFTPSIRSTPTLTRCSATGHVCDNLSSTPRCGCLNPTCTAVVPDAKGPVTTSRPFDTVAEGDEPSITDAPLASLGNSTTSGPPMSTRARALLMISST